MTRTSTVIAIISVASFLAGCDGGSSRLATAEEIEALIEQLAISDEPAGEAPIFTPGPDTPETDRRVIAYQAAAELRSYGKSAFPYLLAHLDDGRQSVAFRNMIPHSVGLACFHIIEDQVLKLPEDYSVGYHRTGVDGERHLRPRFAEPGLFVPDITTWLAERQDKSLAELQIEALEWLIEEEELIGFPTEEDRKRFLYPLQRQIKRIRRSQ